MTDRRTRLSQRATARAIRDREGAVRAVRRTAEDRSLTVAARTGDANRGRRAFRRRGSILVAAMWIIVIVTGLVLVFARSMQVEVLAAANQASAAQAGAVEKGAEQYVLSLVDSLTINGAPGDATQILNSPADTMQVGADALGRPTGYFWLLRPALTDNDAGDFGLVDEASKFNINAGTAADIAKIAGMSPDMAAVFAAEIVDWRDADDNMSSQGAETQYYSDPGSGMPPYRAKNAPFESVDELLLVKDITEEYLYGYDLDHDGALSDAERNATGPASALGSAAGTGRGFFPYVTVYSSEPAKDATGTARLNLNDNTAATQLQQLLTNGIGQQRASQVLNQVRNAPKPYANVFDFAVKGGLKAEELAKVIDGLTTTAATQTKLVGLININTAPAEVLACLPGLTQDDVNTLISKRDEYLANATSAADAAGSTGTGTTGATGSTTGTTDTSNTTTNIAWVLGALPAAKVAAIGGRITGKSYQYSADILAVSGDGRSFKRVRIVVDGTTSPARIMFRKDLTGLGWPLDEDTRQTLRDGGTLDSGVQNRGLGL